MNSLRTFVALNRKASLAVGRLWAHQRIDWSERYCELVAQAVRGRPGQTIVDVGGGKNLRYAAFIDPTEARVIGVDVSDDELRENHYLAEARVADITSRLPFDDDEVDLLTSSSVLEHLEDVSGFIAEAARVLKPGGVMIHVIPSRYASFALLNRWLPERVKLKLLYGFFPDAHGGFPAHYDRCYYTALRRECERHGFEVDVVWAGYYGSSAYYTVLFPVFVVSLLWEVAAWACRARNLASILVIQAHRR